MNTKYILRNYNINSLRYLFTGVSIVGCFFLAILLSGCQDKSIVENPKEVTRVEIHELYLKKYGNDPIKWSDEVKKQYDKDLLKAKAN